MECEAIETMWEIGSNCELRWKGVGEAQTDKGYKVWFSGGEKHACRVGFMEK